MSAEAEPSAYDRLIEAATVLFEARGYDATSVSDIVERAELTKGAFYHYFPSKLDCLHELHSAFIEGELARLEKVIADSSGPADAVQSIMRSFLYGVKNYKALQRIFDEEWRQMETAGFERIRSRRDRILSIVTEQIQRGIDEGIFIEAIEPQVVALGIVGMCGWAHRWFRSNGVFSDGEIADIWSRAILGGIMKQPEGPD